MEKILDQIDKPTEDKKEGWRSSYLNWVYWVPTLFYPRTLYHLLSNKRPGLVQMVQPKEEDRSSSRFFVTDSTYLRDGLDTGYHPVRCIYKSKYGANEMDTVFKGHFNDEKIGKERVLGPVQSIIGSDGKRNRSENFDEINSEFEKAFNSVGYEWDPYNLIFTQPTNKHEYLYLRTIPHAYKQPALLIYTNREAAPVREAYKKGGQINYMHCFS